jgi:hypothetical protein
MYLNLSASTYYSLGNVQQCVLQPESFEKSNNGAGTVCTSVFHVNNTDPIKFMWNKLEWWPQYAVKEAFRNVFPCDATSFVSVDIYLLYIQKHCQ